ELRGLESDFGVVWIEQQSDDASAGNELKQKLRLLRYNIATEPADAGNISARLVEAPDDTCLDWIAAEREHDRDRRSRRLGGNDRRSAADCNDYRDPSGDKIGRQHWQSVILTLGPAEGDMNVLAFDIARVPQSQPKCHLVPSRFARRPAAEEPDHRQRRLLRARRQRPSGYTAAEKSDEFPPPQSIELHLVPASQGRSTGYRIGNGQSGGMARMLEMPAHSSRAFVRCDAPSSILGLIWPRTGMTVRGGYINKSWRPPVPSGRAPRAQRRLRHSPSAARR